MANVLVERESLSNIADSIRAKNGTQNTYKPGQMSAAIDALPNTYSAGDEGKVVSNGELVAQTSDTVTANNTYDTTLINSLTVNVSGGSTINNQDKTIHPLSSQQTIQADSGYTGLGTVTVKAVTTENLSAANIVSGVTVKIGDADDDDSIASVTGTASSGVTLSAMPYPVIFQTTRSSSVALNRAVYKSSTTIGFARSNVTSSAPVTVNNMLTDGTHVFFNASAGSSITYNGNAATFVKDGTDFMLTIPDGFDGTIPFVIS